MPFIPVVGNHPRSALSAFSSSPASPSSQSGAFSAALCTGNALGASCPSAVAFADTAFLGSGITSLLHVLVLYNSRPRTHRHRNIQAKSRFSTGHGTPVDKCSQHTYTRPSPYIHIHLHARSQPGACFPLRFYLQSLVQQSWGPCRIRRRRRSSSQPGGHQPAHSPFLSFISSSFFCFFYTLLIRDPEKKVQRKSVSPKKKPCCLTCSFINTRFASPASVVAAAAAFLDRLIPPRLSPFVSCPGLDTFFSTFWPVPCSLSQVALCLAILLHFLLPTLPASVSGLDCRDCVIQHALIPHLHLATLPPGFSSLHLIFLSSSWPPDSPGFIHRYLLLLCPCQRSFVRACLLPAAATSSANDRTVLASCRPGYQVRCLSFLHCWTNLSSTTSPRPFFYKFIL